LRDGGQVAASVVDHLELDAVGGNVALLAQERAHLRFHTAPGLDSEGSDQSRDDV